MAFKTLQTKRDPLALEALGARVAARGAKLGNPEIPRRADDSVHPELVEPKATVGQRRTPSKRALRKVIAVAGGKW